VANLAKTQEISLDPAKALKTPPKRAKHQKAGRPPKSVPYFEQLVKKKLSLAFSLSFCTSAHGLAFLLSFCTLAQAG
tara:strand:- start:245 stop:475 length:231 start_codon:yes stop_codon:yes gene_type:complete